MTGEPISNPLLPYMGKLVEIKDLANEIKLFRVELVNGGGEAFRDYKPGQFAFVSAWGVGEAPFGIASVPQRGKLLDFAVNRLGSVTTEMHQLGVGDLVGVRGPLGNYFPMDQFKGKNLIVIGGGIGGAPLRPVIQTVLDHVCHRYVSCWSCWRTKPRDIGRHWQNHRFSATETQRMQRN